MEFLDHPLGPPIAFDEILILALIILHAIVNLLFLKLIEENANCIL